MLSRHHAAAVAAVAIVAALALGAPSSAVVATCALGEVANPGGYGCVPALAPGGAVVGTPTEEELTPTEEELQCLS